MGEYAICIIGLGGWTPLVGCNRTMFHETFMTFRYSSSAAKRKHYIYGISFYLPTFCLCWNLKIV